MAWIAAAIIGMYLVSFLPIHYLLFAIAPFSIIAYFIALKVPKDQIAADNAVRIGNIFLWRINESVASVD